MDNKNKIKLSVLVSLYNNQDLITRCLDSIELRDDIEIIITDDCSTDNSYEIAKRWIDTHSNFKNIKLLKHEINQGAGATFNTGLYNAIGEYLITVCDDDYLVKPLSVLIKELDGTDLVYYNLINNNGVIYVLNDTTKYCHVGATKAYRRVYIGDTRRSLKRVYSDGIFYHLIMNKKPKPTEKFTNIVMYHYDYPRLGSLTDINIKHLETQRKIFTDIYNKENFWDGQESCSGRGSDMPIINKFADKLIEVINSLDIDSICDVPCGDFNWMRNILLKLKYNCYVGIDIVVDIIKNNNNKYKSNKIKFECGDIMTSTLPKSDIVFCRDCLVHLNLEHIKQAIENIKISDSKYLVMTTFTNKNNRVFIDINDGEWRPINFNLPPFNFPDPKLIICENCEQLDGRYMDKSLGLWEIKDLSL